MSYLSNIEQGLREIYRKTPVDSIEDELIRFVRAKLVESYKNGIQAAKHANKGQRFMKKPAGQANDE